MTTFTLSLTPEEQTRLLRHLENSGYERRDVAHTRAAAKKPGLSLALYNSGKLVAQGKQLKEWMEFVLEPEILQRLLEPSGTAPGAPIPDTAHIGIDESGKGDFFGPMVIAAFHLEPELHPLLAELGVRDSKRIPSDDAIHRIADRLREKAAGHAELLILKPETYNKLVAKMGSVNRVLAWAHATALENLLTRFPDTPRAVADQFGPEHQIQRALKSKGKQIQLEQRHKAESDPAVAAASILARSAFVRTLAELGEPLNTSLPKGATHVRPTGETLVNAHGPEVLTRIAKTHFRTTRQVLEACGHDPALLGTPEPKAAFNYRKRSS